MIENVRFIIVVDTRTSKYENGVEEIVRHEG